MYSFLDTGESLKCRKCGSEIWCIYTATEGLRLGCSTCDKVITGDYADSMCFEQRLYVEAGRYRDQVKQAGSIDGISIPESVQKHRNQLMLGDRDAPTPSRCSPASCAPPANAISICRP